MDAALPVILAALLVTVGGSTLFVARRFGVWPGVVIPVLVLGLAALRSRMPLGHPDEAMGRGIEVMFIWAPLVLLTALGSVLGLMLRRRDERKRAG